MKAILSHCIILQLFIVNLCFSQKEANVWIFQNGLGIDFNYDRFSSFNVTGMKQSGGSASICDKETGQLLFYTDGRTVWDRNFAVMPNGTGLTGGYHTTQAALIVPYPKKSHLYYLFTTKSFADPAKNNENDSEHTGLHYSIINMNLGNGLGDVEEMEKNNLLFAKSTGNITAIPHRNGRDYWMITHEWGSNRFLVYLINDRGIEGPSFFSIGAHHLSNDLDGWLIPSPNGEKLASAVYDLVNGTLELYDFDNDTGNISNHQVLGNYPRLLGLSFSPDNSKLYFTYYDQDDPSVTRGGLFQMDLNHNTNQDILNSLTKLYFLHETGVGGYDTLPGMSLQLAPDGRLYSSQTGLYLESPIPEIEKRRIFFIDKSNLAGWQSKPSARDFDIDISSITVDLYGFPNFIQSYFNGLEPQDNFLEEQECHEGKITLFPNPTPGLVHLTGINPQCALPLKVNIYNALGQKISSITQTNDSIEPINLNNFNSGIYLIEILTPFRKDVIKIIKSH